MSPASHLVPNPPAHENGHGQPVTQTRFEELLHELTDKFGSATSFVRAPGRARGTAAAMWSGTILR